MPHVIYSQTMACNVTAASTAVKFDYGAKNVTVYVPSCASGADVRFYTSYDGGTTFANLRFAPSSGVAVVGNVTIASAVTNVCVRVTELAGQQYVKAEYSTLVVSSEGTFRYIVEY